ncbi:hypothetical protein MMC12_004596 [Toensbergia leucococca]|nr:hypothetical protein [Toensbergia leucococca]
MRALLSKNKPGVVLIVSSVAGLRSNYAAALYCATKHALVGFSRSMGPADEDEGIKFSVSSETSLSPSAVADAMAELIQEEKYSGGTVMQISVGVKEVVKFDEASQPASDSVDLAVLEMAKEKSYAPIREILARERGNDGGV